MNSNRDAQLKALRAAIDEAFSERKPVHQHPPYKVQFACLAAAVIVQGFALAAIWNWFVVRLFELPRLNLAAGIGLSLLFAVIGIGGSAGVKGKTSGEWFYFLLERSVGLVLIMAIAFIAQLFL